MIFAVDFDGTLSFGVYPGAGPANEGLIEFLKTRKSKGDKLVLWTCREGADLEIAVDWCIGQGIEFDAVNDNLPEVIEKYGCNSRKISCDFYIDDRALAGNVYKLLEDVRYE
jgi:trehalose-6-phosphatase